MKRGLALLFKLGQDMDDCPRHPPAVLPLEKKNSYELCSKLGGLQGLSGRVRKISPPPGFDPQTVNPVASRYTNWAIVEQRR